MGGRKGKQEMSAVGKHHDVEADPKSGIARMYAKTNYGFIVGLNICRLLK